jgi:[ribosomal protein S5]-alanine N-acetyltransferase
MKIETERLILRKPKIDDVKFLYKIIDNDIIKNLFMRYPLKEKYLKELIQKYIAEWEKKERYFMILELKKTKKIVGMAGLKELDFNHGLADVTSFIGKKYRKKGYITEAKIAINEFAFNKLKLRKLKSNVATFNPLSNKMQNKFGMKFEGIKRREYLNPYTKNCIDMNSYSLFKSEWVKVLPKLKKHLKAKIKNLK